MGADFTCLLLGVGGFGTTVSSYYSRWILSRVSKYSELNWSEKGALAGMKKRYETQIGSEQM